MIFTADSLKTLQENDKKSRAFIANKLRGSKETHELIAIYIRLWHSKVEEREFQMKALLKMLEEDIQQKRYLDEDILFQMQEMLNQEFWKGRGL